MWVNRKEGGVAGGALRHLNAIGMRCFQSIK